MADKYVTQGDYTAQPISARTSIKKGKPVGEIMFRIVGGEFDGHQVKYQNALTADAVRFFVKTAKVCGWDGVDISQVSAQINDQDSERVEVAVKESTFDGRIYSTVKYANAISPDLDAERVAAINELLAQNVTQGNDQEIPF